jgi:integrase
MDHSNKRRPRGTGTIIDKRGRFMARLPTADREPLGIYDTYEQAAEGLDGWLAERRDGAVKVASGLTLTGFGEDWLNRRELDEFRGIDTDRSRWKTHILTAHFADWPLKSITRADVIDWIDTMKSKKAAPGHKQARKDIVKRKLSRTTIQNTLNLLRCCLADALDRHMIPENPADGVRLRMKSTRTEDPWTYLTFEEQKALLTCEAIPAPDRRLMQFAIGSGMREGELWNLELRDLHVDGDVPHVVVRFGSNGKPPKNGKIREIPLFGYSLEAATHWVKELPRFAPKNEHKLVFPTARGHRRQDSKPPGGQYKDEKGHTHYRFHDWIVAAGVTRDFRFHDLRHTCGSSLISGLWGRSWSIEEVRDLLGHASSKTTERYAHLAPSALQAAARDTVREVPRKAPVRHQESGDASETLVPPARIGLATFGLGSPRRAKRDHQVNPSWCPIGALRDEGAERLVAERLASALQALGQGQPSALRRLIEAAEEAAQTLAPPTEQVETA